MARIPIDDENVDDQEDPAPQGDPDEEPISAEVEEAPPQSGDNSQLQAERDDLFQRLARLTADYRNSQRRLEQEKQQAVTYANTSLIKSILPVIDNFERALAVDAQKTDLNSVLKGMQIVHVQLIKVLKQQHVEEIAPQPGTPFDPTRHEALMQQADDKYDEPTVTQLLQKGYALHDRTIRPAGVAVSKGT
jgi:molecular chaperone GrpE